MPHDPQNPDSLGDERTLSGERETPAQEDQNLGEQRTNPDGPVSPDGDSTGHEKELVGIDLEPGFLLEETDLSERYEILEELGRGGMGIVHKAHDKRLKRDVAIKRPKKLGKRFFVEAEAHAQMNHQNIVKLIDFGSDQAGPYIIMDYVEGEDLNKVLKQRPLEAGEAVKITGQLCDAITFAHNQGVIHRDIKPSNVLLDANGIPKLMDFGLARDESAKHGQTKSGEKVGTDDYMSPEQSSDSRKVDARSDIYSLAATLYTMLTRKSPKRQYWNHLPVKLRPVVEKGMEEDPTSRFNDADEFRDALQKAIVGDLEHTEEGVCPGCSTKNRIDRKRCSTCSESLEEPCLACNHNNRLWEQVCDNCGEDTLDLITGKREEIRKERATVGSHIREYRYLEARKIVEGLSTLPHRRFEEDVLWANERLVFLDDEYAEQRGMAEERYQNAVIEENLQTSIEILEEIPSPLRTEQITNFLNHQKKDHDRLLILLNEIKRKTSLINKQGTMSTNDAEELIEQTTEYLTLAPGKKVVEQLRARVLEKLHEKTSIVKEFIAIRTTQSVNADNQKKEDITLWENWSGAVGIVGIIILLLVFAWWQFPYESLRESLRGRSPVRSNSPPSQLSPDYRKRHEDADKALFDKFVANNMKAAAAEKAVADKKAAAERAAYRRAAAERTAAELENLVGSELVHETPAPPFILNWSNQQIVSRIKRDDILSSRNDLQRLALDIEKGYWPDSGEKIRAYFLDRFPKEILDKEPYKQFALTGMAPTDFQKTANYGNEKKWLVDAARTRVKQIEKILSDRKCIEMEGLGEFTILMPVPPPAKPFDIQ